MQNRDKRILLVEPDTNGWVQLTLLSRSKEEAAFQQKILRLNHSECKQLEAALKASRLPDEDEEEV